MPNEMLNGLLAFHAITGCDTTSQFTRIGKRTAWKCSSSALIFFTTLVKMNYQVQLLYPQQNSLYANCMTQNQPATRSMYSSSLCPVPCFGKSKPMLMLYHQQGMPCLWTS